MIFSQHKGFDSPYILVIHCDGEESEARSRAIVESNVKKLSLKSKSVSPGQIELNYEVRLKDGATGFINTLAATEGVTHTVLVSYNGDYMS